MNLWAIFLTGLTTGGLTCLAMQGGLLASVVANKKAHEITDINADKELLKQKKREDYIRQQTGQKFVVDRDGLMAVLMFLSAKLVAYTFIGFMLGWVGSFITLSLNARLTFQIFSALYMFATALNLLEVHPIFRYVVLQPPKFLQKIVRNSTKSDALFAPAVLGVFTIFIPCGVTQAMEVLAINSGNPFLGALIMFAFVLGTSPIFTIVGLATAQFSSLWHQRFLHVAALALIAMSVYGINGVFIVLDSPFALQNIGKAISSIGAPPDWYSPTGSGVAPSGVSTAPLVNGKQQVSITVSNNGYSPTQLYVKAGTPVELSLESKGVYSCATSFTLRKFNIFTQLQPNDKKVLAFTPTEKGNFTYSCSMGMYTGVIHVL